MTLPKRKLLRIQNQNYSTADVYFVTVCVKDRENLFWEVGAGIARQPDSSRLSNMGKIAEHGIQNISSVYKNIAVEKYCIMPDHVHMIIIINNEPNGRALPAPTLSRVIQHYKGWVSKQIGNSIWQRSYYDHIIRDEKDYQNTWDYIDQNPTKMGK